jgi:intermembrane space import and assembly protein 40
MQDCFRQHPDVYGAELEDDEVEGGTPAEAPSTGEQEAPSTPEENAQPQEVTSEMKAIPDVEADSLVPKASHDAEKTQVHSEK